EVVAAPAYEEGAVDILRGRKGTRILVSAGPVGTGSVGAGPAHLAAELRELSGGVLVQMPDRVDAPGDTPAGWTLAAGQPADRATLDDLEFAWRAVRSVKSNAILLADEGASVGIGMGQVNRVDS